ncbi:MAG: cystathionine beta-lyase [Alphaproteobacteria bacterium]
MTKKNKHRQDTVLTHAGLTPWDHHGIVNPPVYHASTILSPSVAALKQRNATRWNKDVYSYGRSGTPTTRALEDAVAELEGGYGSIATSSGLAAVTLALTAHLKAGDHLLMIDSAYGPTRTFSDGILDRFGVRTTYYDPLVGGGIAALVEDDTRVIYMESPGSLTFEVQDVPAIAAVARTRGITTMLDNTWATPLFLKPLALGVDVSIHAATKYIVGHSDAMLGLAVCADERTYVRLKSCANEIGHSAAPDDVYLATRGLRTLAVRLKQHQENALTIARWLQSRPEVVRVMYPALEDDPGHAIWKRDFTGASGLLGMVLRPSPQDALAAMLDGMTLFPMGYCWGGYCSLAVPSDPARLRTATAWTAPGPVVRLHIGLEDPLDLIEDLERGFERLNAAAAA